MGIFRRRFHIPAQTAALTIALLSSPPAGATYTGSGAFELPTITAEGVGTFTAPVYTGSGAFDIPTLTTSGSGVALEQGGHLRFYGTASGQIDRARLPLDTGGTSTAIDVGASDFTYEFWMRAAYADNTSSGIADARYSNIILDRDIFGHVRGWVLGVTRQGSELNVCFGVAGASLDWVTQYGTADVGDGLPHHVALVRRQSTGVIELYVDGALDASGTYTTGDLSYPDGHVPGSGQDNPYLVLGTEKHDLGVGYTGRLDELRISDIRRYTTGFTRPGLPFSDDADTVGLYHLDDAANTVVQDSSSSGVNGQLLVGGANNGPTWEDPDLIPFTGAGAFSLPTYTVAGTATFTAPTYTGSGAFDLPTYTVSGSATFTAPTYTGSGAFDLPGYTVAGTGLFATTVFSGNGAFSLSSYTLEGTGTFTAPVYTGSGAFDLPTYTVEGAGTITNPTWTGSGAFDVPPYTVAGVGTFTAPVYTGVGAITLPSYTTEGVGAFTAPTYTGNGAVSLPDYTVAGVGTIVNPSYTGSGAFSLSAYTVTGAGTFAEVGAVTRFVALTLGPRPTYTAKARPTYTVK